MPVRVAVDTGGTFTDFVRVSETGRVTIHKRASTPDDPSEVIRALLAEQPLGAGRLVHGTTVATNAILERRGARTAFVTTAGFADLIEIGRQDRPRLYDLGWRPVAPVVESALRFEVAERVGAGGRVLHALDEADLPALVARLRAAAVESVAVGFLFSPEFPVHEQRVAAALAHALDVPVVASTALVPELREYERFSTATLSAYVAPVLERYLARLAAEVEPAGRLLVMDSAGGVQPWQALRGRAIRTVVSGPAGGAVAAAAYARRAPGRGIVALDMGGTSTDVSLHAGGELPMTRAFRMDGLPVAIPVVDIHTIGAGGGSMGWRDGGGALRVGPRSASAVPGPVCYQRSGRQATVTDAQVLLGRLPPGSRLGESLIVQVHGVAEALAALGAPLGLGPLATARGMLRIIEAEMERAVRRITQERGVDPRGLVLLCFGGAAGLHAVALARALHMAEVWIPPAPGVLSAVGMLEAPVLETVGATLDGTWGEAAARRAHARIAPLEEDARRRLQAALPELPGVERPRLQRELSLRLVGQSHVLDVPWDDAAGDPAALFHRRYAAIYGRAQPDRALEVTAVRSRLQVTVEELGPALAGLCGAAGHGGGPGGGLGGAPGCASGRTPVFLDAGELPVAVPWVKREELALDACTPGPLLIGELSSMTWIPPGANAYRRSDGVLRIVPGPGRATSP